MKVFVRIIIALTPFAILAISLWGLVAVPISKRTSVASEMATQLARNNAQLRSRLAFLRQSPEKVSMPAEMRWRANSPAEAELLLQKAIIETAEVSGVSLQRFGPGSFTVDTTSPVIGLSIESEMTLVSLVTFLQKLELHKPRIAIKILRIRKLAATTRSSDKTNVDVRMGLWGFFGDTK